MKIFIDSADTHEIELCYDTGLIDGVTTNPSLIRKTGRKPLDVYRELDLMGVPDISMEVTGDYFEMLNQASELAKTFGDVATIKLPMTKDGLQVCRDLHAGGVRTNVTLIFNAAQALLAAKAGATYVSPFVGRIDDQGYAGTEVVRSCAALLKNTDTKVLAASIRTTQRVVRSFYNGADIVTMPPKVFWDMYKHVLTDQGLDIFEEAYEAIG
tara:strand:- start:867 stop:1502 length:636 start_codon:yes stop_codon:yes gene_type:complete